MKKKALTQIKNTLWATDFSKNSQACLSYIKEFSDQLQTDNRVLYVLPRFAEWIYETAFFKDEDLIKIVDSSRQEALEKIKTAGEKTGLVFQGDVVEGIESEEIIRFAEKNDIDLIFVGRRGTSQIKDILIGSTTSRLIRSSDIPVFVVPKTKNNVQIKRILSPIDLGKVSLPELKYSIALAKSLDAELYVTHVTEFFSYKVPVLKRDKLIQKINDIIIGIAKESKYKIKNIIYEIGEPAHKIIEIAEQNQIDLIVMTTHQRQGIEKFFLGSISQKVLTYSDIPVLILPPTDYEIT